MGRKYAHWTFTIATKAFDELNYILAIKHVANGTVKANLSERETKAQ